MPFGLRNASLLFQLKMDFELARLPFARCYIDDILIFSNTLEEHYHHVKAVLKWLNTCGLRAHPKKCRFAYQEIKYLGHVIKPGIIEPQEAKVSVISAMLRPVDVALLRAFLGLVNYYRRFFKDLSRVCVPLYALLKRDAPWIWGQEQDLAWHELKEQLTTALVLARPQFDKEFLLYTDWSQTGLGAVLAQLDESGQERVVAYVSRSNNQAEGNTPLMKENTWQQSGGVLHFRPYLYGRRFQIITDH